MPKATITITNNVKGKGVRETIKSTKYLLLFVFKHKGGKQYAVLFFIFNHWHCYFNDAYYFFSV